MSQAMTPRQIVEALDRHIVGQDAAKRAVAVAMRNRWRRLQLPPELRDEVAPKNIVMIGPTGVGKTEIARRLAALANAPFIKVEASKYTEVGYHGRDVESIIRDLLELAVNQVRGEQTEVVRQQADGLVEERLLDNLLPSEPSEADDADAAARRSRTREKLRGRLRAGELNDREVELTLEQRAAPVGMFAAIGGDHMDPGVQDFLERIMPSHNRTRRVTIAEARRLLFAQASESLIDKEKAVEMAIKRTENSGIVFLDEIDKICGPPNEIGPDVSRQGVQRDLLPIVEGCTVMTRHGPVRTDHILFIAAGAFHGTRPADLIPEFQGRFPLRVELGALTADDFVRILTEPQNAMIRQQVALMATEGVTLRFTDDAIRETAHMAARANEMLENIGARRLHTVLEKVVEDIAFLASDAANKEVEVDADYVRMRLADILEDRERSGYEL